MVFTQRLLWGDKGFLRKTGIAPLNTIQREKELKLRFLQHKIDLVEVDINKGIEQILISYLLKRQKMF